MISDVVTVGKWEHLMVTIVYLFQVTSLSIMCSVQISFEAKFQLQALLVYNSNLFSVKTIFAL